MFGSNKPKSSEFQKAQVNFLKLSQREDAGENVVFARTAAELKLAQLQQQAKGRRG